MTRASESEAPSLERALAELDRPTAHEAVRGPTPLLDRLYASPRVHRLAPDRLAMWLAATRARILWRLSKSRRERARAQVALLLEGTGREHEVERVARLQVAEEAMRCEQKLRPWMGRRWPIDGMANLESAMAGGRGALVMTSHVGAYGATGFPLAYRGYPAYMAGGGWLYADVYEGREALVSLVQRQAYEEAGGRYVPRGNSYPVYKALLARGEMCVFFLDVPGSTETRLLGKRAWVASGLARLARETGAPIVPAVCHGGCAKPRLQLYEPIDPRRFGSEQELMDRLAATLTGLILEVGLETCEPNDFPPLIFREQAERYGWAFR